jgi:drug/metabolite transporter (DMT)-like permease
MNKKAIRGSIFLLFAAIFWGSAFVAQDEGLKFLGPYSVNGLRFLFGALFLIPVFLVSDFIKIKRGADRKELRERKKNSVVGGIICGLTLAIASSLQQVGLVYTTAGKSGFITAMYIVLVPVFGIFFGKKAGLNVWLAVLIAVAGLFFISVTEELTVNFGDILTMVCAVAFAVNIMVVDKFVGSADGIFMSFVQILTAGVLCIIPMLISKETITWQTFTGALPYILYIAVFSCCVAYTFQILGQADTPPALASVLMSLESVFAMVFGALILEERFSAMQYLGAGLMFVAILLAQFNPFKRKNKKVKSDE